MKQIEGIMENIEISKRRLSGNGVMHREIASLQLVSLGCGVFSKSIDMLTSIDKDLTVNLSFLVYIDGKAYEFSSLKKAFVFYEKGK